MARLWVSCFRVASPYSGHGPAADLNASASDAAFNELGLQLLHEYCWRAGTYVLSAENPDRPARAVLKRIEQMRAGDMVLCPSDKDPYGPLCWKRVLKVFHNKPAALLRLETDRGNVLYPTAGHPILVVERGWLRAEMLKSGDPLRSHFNKAVRVASLVDSGLVERVYNLLIEGHHTYFVSDGDPDFSVLGHNDSPGPVEAALRSGNEVQIEGGAAAVGGADFAIQQLAEKPAVKDALFRSGDEVGVAGAPVLRGKFFELAMFADGSGGDANKAADGVRRSKSPWEDWNGKVAFEGELMPKNAADSGRGWIRKILDLMQRGGDLDNIPQLSGVPRHFPSFVDPNTFFNGRGRVGWSSDWDDLRPSVQARISLRYNLEYFKSRLFEAIYHLMDGVTVDDAGRPVTEEDKVYAANKIADTYIRAVDKFLAEHFGARPEQGMRWPWQNEYSHPWCDDWATAIHNELFDLITKDAKLKHMFSVQRGQWFENPPPQSGRQHNWVVLIPLLPDRPVWGGNSPPPASVPILFLDPWYLILPFFYRPGDPTHAPLMGMGVTWIPD